MKQEKPHPSEQLYRLSELRQKPATLQQHSELVKLLQYQVELLKKAVKQAEDVLAVYWETVNNIARCVDVGTEWKGVKCQDIQKLSIWLSQVQKRIESVAKERPEAIIQTVEVERIVEVQRPVFIEKKVEVYRPIIKEVEKQVVKEVVKYVQKPVFVQKIIQKAVYVGGNSHMKCVKCATIM